ncbi:hypothetical protein BDY19DRAFT_940637 [Irpex rosettiformis]|uniref:Uncharacterized protein n=1 Tax=Irpex rosettiformis TaxID=378272 RepID=A0ACB8U642_9APHY|nr:hypothetical protein BDY19DRAFT_940637 [Irpex rosettiformis]
MKTQQLQRGKTVFMSTFKSASPLEKLPDEVLAHIFKLGLVPFGQPTPGSLSEVTAQKSFRFPVLQDIPFTPLDTSFEDSVSKVCRKWRCVALDTALLWNRVDFWGGPLYERSLSSIQRSKNALLDILILAPDILTTGVDYQQKNKPSPIEFILDVLLPHLHRWRSFVFHAVDVKGRQMRNLISKLGDVGAARELQLLCLSAQPTFAVKYMPQEMADSRNIRLFGGETPKLRAIWISRSFFSWKLSNIMQANLTNLIICNMYPTARVSITEFLHLLQSTPQLHFLDLYVCQFYMTSPEESDTTPVVTLPELAQFRTTQSDSDWTVMPLLTLLRHVILPKLRHFSLDFLYCNDCREVVATLLERMPLENLTHVALTLDLWSQKANCADLLLELCKRLVKVEELHLKNPKDNATNAIFCSTWKNQEAFPRVTTLLIEDLRGEKGPNVEFLRSIPGRPLQEIRILSTHWKPLQSV